MRQRVTLEVQGLGIILYSPFAVAHIRSDEDYLAAHFWQPADVARHVVDCTLSAFATGSPGTFHLTLHDGVLDAAELAAASAKAALGVEVRDSRLCVRDLYDLMQWSPDCPEAQQVALADGFYSLTAYTSAPPSGILGDHQEVVLHLAPSAARPVLRWSGVPDLVASPTEAEGP